ncbi:MAG: SNF2-related protein [Blastocatellia bacterium]
MALASELSSDFTSIVRARGADYFRLGAVRIYDSGPFYVFADVESTRNYSIRMTRNGDEIIAYCECPHFQTEGPCKHLWAVVLTADEKGCLQGDGRRAPLYLVPEEEDEDEDDMDLEDEDWDEDYFSSVLSGGLEAEKLSGQLGWKEQLAALGRPIGRPAAAARSAWPENRRMIYVVDIPATIASQHLILDALTQDRKQNGDWGKPRKQRISRHQIAELPDPIDARIFAMLAGAREQQEYTYHGYNYQDAYDTVPSRYRLTHPLPQILLPLIARSERCFLKSEEGADDLPRIEWDEDGPWRFAIRLGRDAEAPEQFEVRGILSHGGEEIDLSVPRLLLHGGLVITKERIATLEDSGAFHWISILRRLQRLVIPENQIGEFMAQVLSETHPPPMELPEELRYETISSTPQPCLTFKQQRHTPRLRARLTFDYAPGGQRCILDAEDPRGGVYELEQRRYIMRDSGAEAAFRQRLLSLGLKPAPPNPAESMAGWEVAPTKLPGVVRHLIGEGWHVEAEGRAFRNPGEMKIQVSSGIDWFELHGSVNFGDTRANLPELLAALKRGDNMVKLDDGSYGMLPEEWMKKYGMLAGLGQAHEDHMRFRKTQVGVLDALLASQPEAGFDESFQRVREELKRFEGVNAAEPPEGFVGELRPYQKEGLGWIHFLRQFGFGGCLADDMGLGKTIQVLALLEARREMLAETPGQEKRLSLAVVPKSLVFNWKAEAGRFSPKLRILDHTGQFRDKEGQGFADYDLILTTYGTLRNDAILFKDIQFDYIILDEAQAIKNADTASAKAARLLRGDHRLALSGTPVENHLGELWSIFEFLNPGMLGGASVFKLTGASARNPDEETRKLLAHALRPFILRRTKSEVARDLPEKLEQTIFCELEPKQRKLYNELRDHYRNSLLKRVDAQGLAKSKMHILEALLRLRQAACHPGLIDKARVREASAKIDLLIPQLAELFEENHKVLVFSQFTSLLAIVREHLDREKIAYEYLDGQTRDRQARVEHFQNDPECRLFLISLKAGGLGLNLTAAEYVYLLDPWWNPAVEAQAVDRAHRIGQTKQVFAYRIIARDTVEEKVLALQNTKRDLADAIINADNSVIRTLGREDLELLLS